MIDAENAVSLDLDRLQLFEALSKCEMESNTFSFCTSPSTTFIHSLNLSKHIMGKQKSKKTKRNSTLHLTEREQRHQKRELRVAERADTGRALKESSNCSSHSASKVSSKSQLNSPSGQCNATTDTPLDLGSLEPLNTSPARPSLITTHLPSLQEDAEFSLASSNHETRVTGVCDDETKEVSGGQVREIEVEEKVREAEEAEKGEENHIDTSSSIENSKRRDGFRAI